VPSAQKIAVYVVLEFTPCFVSIFASTFAPWSFFIVVAPSFAHMHTMMRVMMMVIIMTMKMVKMKNMTITTMMMKMTMKMMIM